MMATFSEAIVHLSGEVKQSINQSIVVQDKSLFYKRVCKITLHSNILKVVYLDKVRHDGKLMQGWLPVEQCNVTVFQMTLDYKSNQPQTRGVGYDRLVIRSFLHQFSASAIVTKVTTSIAALICLSVMRYGE